MHFKETWTWILLLAVFGAALSIISAIGPSRHESTQYRWPSATEPITANPETNSIAGTELLLVDHSPADLHVSMGCLVNEGLVFKTSLHPEHTGGLLIKKTDLNLEIWIGSILLSDQILPSNACNNELHIENSSWTLTQDGKVTEQGIIEKEPTVSALVAPSNLLAQDRLSVELTTKTHGSTPTTFQYLTWIGSAVFLLGAIFLATISYRREAKSVNDKTPRDNSLIPIDVIVITSTILIMGLGLTNYDDGWVLTTATQWTGSGIFPQYYEKFNTFVPLGWLHDLIYLGLGNISRNIWWLRLPALLCAIGGWFALRAAISLIAEKQRNTTWWILASSYLLGVAAWHVTLRPEPIVALLAALILLLSIKFFKENSPSLLMGAVLLAILSVTIHTSGIVTFAPLIAILPSVLSSLFIRKNISWKAILSIIGSSICVFALFVFIDTDLNRWLTNRDNMAQLGAGYHQQDWTDEITRYDILFRHIPYNNPIRIFTVLFGLAGLIMTITRPKSPKRPELNIASDSLLFAFLLLLLTPSKWPWHFGSLVPLLAAGLAVEALRSTLKDDKEHRSSTIRFAILSIFVFMIAEPSAYNWLSSIWTWVGSITAIAFLWMIIQTFKIERTSSTTLFLVLSIGTLGVSIFFPKILFLFILLIFGAITKLNISATKILENASKWIAPTLLLATLTDLIITWFGEGIYSGGGIKRVYEGVQDILPLPVIILLLLGALFFGRKRYLKESEPESEKRRIALPALLSTFFILGVSFLGAIAWDGAHNTQWTTTRQSLWGSAGLSPCGLPATLGYHDPNLASPLEEIEDFNNQEKYDPPASSILPVFESPIQSVRLIPGAPIPNSTILGTYDSVLKEEATGWFSTPWYLIPNNAERIYFETTGRVTPEDGTRANEIELQFAIINDGEITDFTSEDSGVNHDSVRWQTSEIQLTPGRWNAMRAVSIDRQEGSYLGISNLRSVGFKRNFQATLDEGHYDGVAWITPRLVLQFPCLESSKIANGRAEAPNLIVDFQYIEDSPFEYIFDVYDYSPNNIIRGNLLRLRLREPNWLNVPYSHAKHWS